MIPYSTLSDDFFINVNLNTEMQLPSSRETVLDFFGRVQKSYPTMRNFYTRENGDFVLEEDKDQPHYRWACLEPRRICSGYVNPPSVEEAMEQHRLALELAPYMLSVSPLDCEALDYLVGFDFLYRGNHDELVAEALGVGTALEGLLDLPGARPLNYEPTLTVSLDESCRRQCRLMIETRTNAYQVRRNEFAEESISVYFTVRQYGSLSHDTSYPDALDELSQDAERLLNDHVVGEVLQPLAQAIATK
ncbi:MAG: hypothetical protein DWQ45_13780 [Planctomycetota bacterium]|nr:MAG: hypothetical protein DWQ29_20735 [Planctomycetota bacterium]REK34038.1 MAG: hypothetical protein DWQ45_13780 [Planctomycetota bacterium]